MSTLRDATKATAKVQAKTPEKKVRKRYQVPAVQRAFAILDALNQSSFGLTAQEVSRAHNLPYSTAFYLLETMLDSGYVARQEDSKKYSLGYKLFAFRDGGATRQSLNLRAQAFPSLEELTEVTRLTGHLAILEKNEAVYIERSEPKSFIRLNTWVGERKLLHCTGVGKALLMYLPAAEIRRMVGAGPLVRRTARTITRVDALIENLSQSAARGYAVDDGEDEEEGRGIAAALFDSEGRVVASLGLAGTLQQTEDNRMDGLGRLVRNYASQISQRLGYQGPGAVST
jgi:DNA-binding IclR family transcriptional regulator